MKNYRSREQFEEITDNCINGNWSDAAQNCVEYGFFANDLIRMNEQHEDISFEELTDIAVVIELATKMRFVRNQ